MVHRGEELLVGVGHSHLLLEELYGLDGRHVRKVFAQHPRAVHHVARQEQVFAARTRCDDVDRRVDTFVGELAVELELHVARALELFENHLVHLRTGVDQRRGDDRQRPFLLRVAGCTEETLGFVERRRINLPSVVATRLCSSTFNCVSALM